MLGIGKITYDKLTYHLDAVADGADDYYFSAHEAQGVWIGAGCADLGLTGQVTRRQHVRALLGRDPRSGEPLTRTAEVAGGARRLPGYDLTLSAPKSVSVLWGLTTDDGIRQEIQDGHDRAGVGALRYLESVASLTRRGRSDTPEMPTTGFVAAAFRHRTSRAGDPALHTHVVVPNIALGLDGRWSAIDGRLLYANGKSAGYVYQALLRGELTRRLGVVWDPVQNGHADLADSPPAVIRAFSRRRADIVARRDAVAAQRALADAAEAASTAAVTEVTPGEIALETAVTVRDAGATRQLATLETRSAKGDNVDMRAAVHEWRVRADGLGFTERDRRSHLGRQSLLPVTEGLYEHMAARLAGEPLPMPQPVPDDHLAKRSSTFSRRDVVMGWCMQLAQGAGSVDQITGLAEHFLATHPAIVRAEGQHGLSRSDGIRLANGGFVPARADVVRYTTRSMQLLELSLAESGIRRECAGLGIARARAVDASIRRFAEEAGSPLTPGQEAAVRRITGSGAGVDVVVGRAGTGKTTALRVAKAAWEASGLTVFGAAKSAAAARNLELESGIPSRSLDSLLMTMRVRPEGSPLGPGGVLVVDEAAMTETRTLAAVTQVAEERGWKVVLVGDDQQLREIDAGGGFRGLRERLGAVVLDENLRQREPWEREAVELVRRGEGAAALEAYLAHGRVEITPSRDAALDLMVDRLWSRRRPGELELLQARRNADVTDLNRLVQERRRRAGELGRHSVLVADHDLRVHVGDRVLTRVTSKKDGIINGLRGEVVAVAMDPERREAPALTIRIDGGEAIDVSAAYLRRTNDVGLPALDLAYATTVHRNQGVTAARSQILVDAGLTADALYVGLTRGVVSNEMVLVAGCDDHDDGVAHWSEAGSPRRAFEACVRVIESATPKTMSVDAGVVVQNRAHHDDFRDAHLDRLLTLWRRSHPVTKLEKGGAPQPDAIDREVPGECQRPDSRDAHLFAIERLLDESRDDLLGAVERYELWRVMHRGPSDGDDRDASFGRAELPVSTRPSLGSATSRRIEAPPCRSAGASRRSTSRIASVSPRIRSS